MLLVELLTVYIRSPVATTGTDALPGAVRPDLIMPGEYQREYVLYLHGELRE